MKIRIIAMLSLVAIAATMSCAKEGGGSRPAPNSVPAPQPAPAPGTPAQQPANNGGEKPAVPQEPVPPSGKAPTGGNKEGNKPTDPVVTNSRLLQYDNGGSPADEKLSGKTFFINNYDPINLPMQRQVIVVSADGGGEKTIDGSGVTHLNTEAYLACTRPECVKNVDSIQEYNMHAQSCWIPTLAQELAKFEFSFSKDGTLRFAGNINGIRYGATNIEYSFNGKRKLLIAPFLAAGTVSENGKDVTKAIKISAVPGHGYPEARDTIVAVNSEIERNKNAFKIRSTIAIDHGSMDAGRFAPAVSSRRYVGGLLTYMEPISPANFKVFDAQE